MKGSTSRAGSLAKAPEIDPSCDVAERVAKATVYRFTWWDNHARKEMVSPRFATLEAITRCKGKHIEDSRLVVDARAVDRNGFYSIPIG